MWGQEHGDTWDRCWDISGHLRGNPWFAQELPSSLTGLWVSHCSYTWIVPIPFLKSGAQQQEDPYWLQTKKSNPVLSYLLAPVLGGEGVMGELREDYLHYFTPQMELMSLFPFHLASV